jgi:hypothetical protein
MDTVDGGYSGLRGAGLFALSVPGYSVRIVILQSMITYEEQHLHFIFNALVADR